MIFEYNELKEYVDEDFERFCRMGFNEKQIFPAILNEYEHGDNFSIVESLCIHVFIALNYAEKKLNNDEVIKKIVELMSDETEKKVMVELGDDYTKYIADLNIVRGS